MSTRYILSKVLLILAVVAFLLAAFNQPVGSLAVVPIGLALLAAGLAVA